MTMNKKTYQTPRMKTFILYPEQHLLEVSSNTLGWGGEGSENNGGSEACSRDGDWDDD